MMNAPVTLIFLKYSTSIKASEEVTVDNSKDDGVVEYQSCASISSDIDGDR